MSREFSDEFFSQITNEVNDDPILLLVRLTTDSGDLYFVNNTEDVTSNGQLYTAFPVKVTLATDDGETQPRVKIVFDNVTLELIEEIRSQTTPIGCELDVVLASNPDSVELSVLDLNLRNVDYDYQTVKADLTVDDILNSRFPADSYTPTDHPGIFA